MMITDKLFTTGSDSQTGVSKYIYVPMLHSKAKSLLGRKIVRVVEESEFGSSSPLIKKLFVKNVQICCVLVETTGAQSLGVIYASAPILLKLLTKSNPKLKKMLEDEKLASYINFFKDTDLTPLLESLQSITVVIHNGVKKVYPIFCITMSRNVLDFGGSMLKEAMHVLYVGLVHTFNFICEDLPPLLKSALNRNMVLAKFVAKNLPMITLASAKGMVLISLCVRRLFSVILRAVKRCVNIFCMSFRNTAYRNVILKIVRKVYHVFKDSLFVVFSSETYQSFKTIFGNYLKTGVIYLKENFPMLCVEYLKFLRLIAPRLKNIVMSVIHFTSQNILTQNNVASLINFSIETVSYAKFILKNAKPYAIDSYHYLCKLALSTYDIVCYLSPILLKCASTIVTSSSERMMFLIHNIKYIVVKVKNSELISPQVLNAFCEILSKLLHVMRDIFYFGCQKSISLSSCTYKSISSPQTKQMVLNTLSTLQPIVYPLATEISKSVQCGINVVSDSSLQGLKRVLPSVYNSVKVVLPDIILANSELMLSVKNSAAIVFPDLLKAIVAVHPDISNASHVVFEDGCKALVEVAIVSTNVIIEANVACKAVAGHLPTVAKAVKEVTSTTSQAMAEITVKTLSAKSKALQDIKCAVCVLSSSIVSADIEVVVVINEIAFDVRELLSNNPQAQKVINMIVRESVHSMYKSYSNAISAQNAISKRERLFATLMSQILRNYLYKCLSLCAKGQKHVSEPFSGFGDSKIIHALKHSVPDSLWLETQKLLLIACTKLSSSVWVHSKDIASAEWALLCNASDEYWALMELISPKIWCYVRENVPVNWLLCKNALQKTYGRVCYASPVLWDAIVTASPVLWRSSKKITQKTWNFHLKNLGAAWEILVPVSSETWSFAVNNIPSVWNIVCENSKERWVAFCEDTEKSWTVVTERSSSSWELLRKCISNSWKMGMRPITKFYCHNTVLVLVKTIEISHDAYTKAKDTLDVFVDSVSGRSLTGDSSVSKFHEARDMHDDSCRYSEISVSSDSLVASLEDKWIYNKRNALNVITRVVLKPYKLLFFTMPLNCLATLTKLKFNSFNKTSNIGENIMKSFSSFVIQDDICFGDNNCSLFVM